MFKPAQKQQSKLRMTIDGPAGSGKTYTALRFAHAIAARNGGKIAVVDTERGSASKYVGEAPDGTLNRNGVHAAAAALAGARGGVKASPEEKRRAARALLRLYRELEEDPPESIKRLAE